MIGKKIKKLKKKKGTTQNRLAKLADIPYTTLTKIESGVIKQPGVGTVARIAKALNTKIDKLVNGE